MVYDLVPVILRVATIQKQLFTSCKVGLEAINHSSHLVLH